MIAYLKLLDEILEAGVDRDDRTGVGTRGLFGRQMRFDLSKGFPLADDQTIAHAVDLLRIAVVSARRHEHPLAARTTASRIWDEWADEDGNLGPVYGHQWRSWPTPDGETIDQIAWVQNEIRTNPKSRRLIVSAWNVADVQDMRLPPCHVLFQFYVADDRLSCQLYQRSADLFLGSSVQHRQLRAC